MVTPFTGIQEKVETQLSGVLNKLKESNAVAYKAMVELIPPNDM
jgi:hypothetical protein